VIAQIRVAVMARMFAFARRIRQDAPPVVLVIREALWPFAGGRVI
jgi:hypothetical protein